MKGLYLQTNGEIAIIFLQDDEDYHRVCLRCTPHNTPYLIVEDSDLPEDWSTSSAWEADFSTPDGYGLGPQRYFIQKAQQEIQEGINVEYNIGLIAQMEAELQ